MAKTDATDFTTGTLELPGGVVLSRKMRVVGMLYLEDKYDKPLADIGFEGDKIEPVLDLLVAMMLSHDPDLDPAEARRLLGRLDADDLTKATAIIKSGTDTGDEPEPEKNVQEPAGQ